MTSYRVQLPGTGLAGLIGLMVYVVGFLLLIPAREFGGGTLSRVICAVFLLAMMALAVFHSHWRIQEIRILDDGTVQLIRGVGGTTTFSVMQIWELEGGYNRDYNGNPTTWKFTIRGQAGIFRFGEFSGIMQFATRIVELNPAIRITGLWPRDSPPGAPITAVSAAR